ncbi:hypothetical protein [Streptomyces sp. NPDC058657]|uniref:hypothetical protein n=1 Tax=unclassified Streptomyces TaxID=2593676 RepID=UPI003652A0F8
MVEFRCRAAISPYWLGVHEAVITGEVTPDPGEAAWHAWMTQANLREAVRRWRFIPDGQAAFARYLTYHRSRLRVGR